MKKRILVIAAVLGLGTAITAPVLAQSPMQGQTQGSQMQGQQQQGMGMMQRGGMGNRMQFMCANLDARLAGMLAYAETRLQITETQKPAWSKFADAARASTQPVRQACTTLTQGQPPATVPERLARMEGMMQARLSALQAVRPAVNELYASLTPEQQQTANSLMSHGHHHRSH